jgi:hypothetical protein
MEHAGLYVSDVRSRALEQQLQGIPQAVVLENAFRQQYLFVPNMKLKRPEIPGNPLNTGTPLFGVTCLCLVSHAWIFRSPRARLFVSSKHWGEGGGEGKGVVVVGILIVGYKPHIHE